MVVTQQLNHECRYLLLRAYNYWDFPTLYLSPRAMTLLNKRRLLLSKAQ